MIYRLNKNETLEGTPQEIVEALLTDHRAHLYRLNKVTLLSTDGAAPLHYYKSKTR